ncbi:pentapeptide repeat-containing protein [Streptomyces sp. NPDC001621]|uniref:pentapeptide repeat-containing protein n=1 Tax=Streptomyces sp. NPDC001621 TaxID=3364594 RepID=UPI0036AD9D01
MWSPRDALRPVCAAGRSCVFTGADLAGADLAGADFVVTPFEAVPPAEPVEAAVGAVPDAPARAEQTGQAPQPWACCTLVATAIWALLEAWSAVGA